MDPTNRNTALASTLVEELGRCGVRDAVVCPGSRSTPLALALWREPAIDARVIVDERSGGYFAIGAAQATGRPVAIVCTSGTAAANLHPAICEANEAAVPLIVMTADRPPELRGIGAGQTIDQLGLYGTAARWFCEVGTHEADDAGLLHYRSVACRAFATAAGDPRPGPVHLNLAWRDPLGPEPRAGEVTATRELALRGRRGSAPLTRVHHCRGEPSELGRFTELLAAHERGIIVAGRGVAKRAEVLDVAKRTHYPILAEPTSQLRLGAHDRRLVISAYDLIARTARSELAPELVLRFGEMPTSKALRTWLTSLDTCRQVVVDPAFGWHEPTRTAELIVRSGDGLAGALGRSPTDGSDLGGWTEAWLRAERAARGAIDAELASLGKPTEPGLQTALGGLYADGDLVYTASSMPIRDQETFLAGGEAEVRFLANRGANGIDGLISSGIGAGAASGSPTWIVTGDLGLHHDANALAALRHAEAPVRLVVIDNDGGGIFEFLPQAEQLERDEFEAVLGTPLGLDPARLAALHDLPYLRIDDLAQLGDAAAGTALIHVPVDRSSNRALHERLGAAVAAAVADALS